MADALDGLARGRGTVIGDGLSLTLEQIEADRAANGDRPAASILLSDGRDTGSEVPPDAAAQRAAAAGVPVFTVVLGGHGRRRRGANSGLLEEIAETTDGGVVLGGDGAELQGVYEALSEQLESDLAIGGHGTAVHRARRAVRRRGGAAGAAGRSLGVLSASADRAVLDRPHDPAEQGVELLALPGRERGQQVALLRALGRHRRAEDLPALGR